MAKDLEVIEEKEYSKFQWFFMIIFIPTVFAAILAIIVFMFMGINVLEKGKEISMKLPVVSSWITNNQDNLEPEVDVDELQTTIVKQQSELEALNEQLVERDEEIVNLNREIDSLARQIEIFEEDRQNNQMAIEVELTEIAKTYESMSSKNAAKIISELDTTEALQHISTLKPETKASILAKMEPEKAAVIMSELYSE
ncbi:MotE family protein [Anaerobacillus sp. MEB173]|uniref:MotE family protein n=1 Tax=Anaerobacillus sp. MEB173 TaxID=3383345 RepID=UPI003F93B307